MKGRRAEQQRPPGWRPNSHNRTTNNHSTPLLLIPNVCTSSGRSPQQNRISSPPPCVCFLFHWVDKRANDKDEPWFVTLTNDFLRPYHHCFTPDRDLISESEGRSFFVQVFVASGGAEFFPDLFVRVCLSVCLSVYLSVCLFTGSKSYPRTSTILRLTLIHDLFPTTIQISSLGSNKCKCLRKQDMKGG